LQGRSLLMSCRLVLAIGGLIFISACTSDSGIPHSKADAAGDSHLRLDAGGDASPWFDASPREVSQPLDGEDDLAPTDAGPGADGEDRGDVAQVFDATEMEDAPEEPIPMPDANPADAAILSGNTQSAIGYSLGYPGPVSHMRPFINLLDDSSEWRGHCPDTEPSCDDVAHLDLDAKGWPRSLAFKDNPLKSYTALETYFSLQNVSEDVGKTFVITWEGDGVLSLFDVKVQGAMSSRRLTFVYPPGMNLVLYLNATDPRNVGSYVRNIKIYRQDHEALVLVGERFNPAMLDFLKPFGTLSFAKWMDADEAEDRDVAWTDRARLDYHTLRHQFVDPLAPGAGRTMGGYPIELMVALSNRVGADPHFSLPYRSSEDFVHQFAALVAGSLAPNLRATVEYSTQTLTLGDLHSYWAAEARTLWPTGAGDSVQYKAVRSARVCTIWKEVFAGQTGRMRCLLTPQYQKTDSLNLTLTCPAYVALNRATNKPCGTNADALGLIGRFGGELGSTANVPIVQSWLAQGEAYAYAQSLRQLEFGDVLPAATSNHLNAITAGWGMFIDEAKLWSLEPYMVEAGVAFELSADAQVKDFLVALSHQPEIRWLFGKLYTAWKKQDGTILTVFGEISNTSNSAILDQLGDYSHPKYQSVLDFVSTTACWWDNCDRSKR